MIGTIIKGVVMAGATAGAAVIGVVGGVRLADDWGWFDPSEEEKKKDDRFVVSILGSPRTKKKAKKKSKR